MSTIGSLLALMDPNIKPYSEGMESVNRAQRGQTLNQTELIQLAELKRAQEARAQELAFYQQHPEMIAGGGSIIGSLGAGPGMPPGGPLTQTTTMPGQAPTTQQVPGGQDLSRFAGVSPPGGGPIPTDVMQQVMPQSTPPQSILASLAPQQQRNPLIDLVRNNPQAGLAVQQQMQTQQDRQMTMQTQALTNRGKVLDYLGRMAQGATDQDSWKVFLEEADRVQPGSGGRLPQMYSKEARDRVVAQALEVKETMTLQVQDLTAQAAVIRARKEGRSVDVDNQLRAMGVQPGQETPAQIKEALQAVQEGKIAVSASHGTGQIVMTPAGAVRVGKDNQVEVIKGPDGQPIYDKPTAAAEGAASYGDRAKRAHDNAVALENKGITPSVWSKVGDMLPFGMGNYLVGEDQRDYRRAVNQFGGALLRKESGMAISATEYDMIDRTFFPQPNDSKKQIEDKRREREAIIKNLQEEGKGAGRTGTQAQPTSQGSAKPVSQMSAEETRAEIAAIKARGGR